MSLAWSAYVLCMSLSEVSHALTHTVLSQTAKNDSDSLVSRLSMQLSVWPREQGQMISWKSQPLSISFGAQITCMVLNKQQYEQLMHRGETSYRRPF